MAVKGLICLESDMKHFNLIAKQDRDLVKSVQQITPIILLSVTF